MDKIRDVINKDLPIGFAERDFVGNNGVDNKRDTARKCSDYCKLPGRVQRLRIVNTYGLNSSYTDCCFLFLKKHLLFFTKWCIIIAMTFFM